MVVSFLPGRSEDRDRLDARLFLRDSLPHPDLAGVVGGAAGHGMTLCERPRGQGLRHPGTLPAPRGARLGEADWGRVAFATHPRMPPLCGITIRPHPPPSPT